MRFTKIQVGYIPSSKICLRDSIIELVPLTDFEDIKDTVTKKFFVKEGFCFPILEHALYRHEILNNELVEVKVSDRPPYQPELFRFHSTHSFTYTLQGSEKPLNDFVSNPSFFLLQIIGYISGYRVMPSSFWFDGKIPVKPTNNIICNSYEAVLAKALNFWLSLSEDGRKDILGIFYFYNRTPSYHWPFEKFSQDFMVFDSAMGFYSRNILKSNFDKKSRYEHFLKLINLHFDINELIILAGLRNDLFHEIKWVGGPPGFFNDSTVFESTFKFRKFLHAVIGRLLGLEGSYFENTDWGDRGTYLFDAK